VLALPGPGSFTGEDVVELHAHGSPAVADALLAACVAAGARIAERGEFTRRAVAAGRLDLAEAEGLADLIDAETEAQRTAALRQMGGALSGGAEAWRERLIAAAAPLEAAIDFPDEADVPAAIAARAAPEIRALKHELAVALQGAGAARALRDGVSVVIIGPPNAGKSSIFNALLGADRAIVTPVAGTTRDVLEARLDLGGVLVRLLDTAGLRETGDAAEAEGVRRAKAEAEAADIRIRVIDGAAPDDRLQEPVDGVVVFNKADVADPRDRRRAGADVVMSAATGEGLAALVGLLSRLAAGAVAPADAPALSRARHVEAVRDALDALARAEARLGETPELAAEDVRLAARALGRITGRVDVEDVLDRIFASFCIGK